jgi:hypothetical protein
MKLVVAVALVLAAAAAVSSAARVDVVAGSFTDMEGTPLSGFTLLHEETQRQYTLDARGRLSLDLPVGSNVTLTVLKQKGYTETQSATVTVPRNGLFGLYNEMVLQVPSDFVYDVFNLVVPGKRNFSQCQVVATVCNYRKTYTDLPQGWPGVVARITPALNEYTFYFGTWGPFSNDTNPLPNNLTSTSWDGGVLFSNVQNMTENQDFVVSAHFGATPFSRARVRCIKPGRLINAAPNQGPRAQAPIKGRRPAFP